MLNIITCGQIVFSPNGNMHIDFVSKHGFVSTQVKCVHVKIMYKLYMFTESDVHVDYIVVHVDNDKHVNAESSCTYVHKLFTSNVASHVRIN